MKIYIYLALLFFYGCASSVDKKECFADVVNKLPENLITSLRLDTIYLDSVESSYVGLLDINKNEILLIDKKFCYVFFFDKDGNFIKRQLGQGPGPKELRTGMVDGYSKIDNGYLFVGGGNDCHLYNENFEIQKEYVINKGHGRKEDYDSPWIYTLSYEHLQMKSCRGYLYYTVFSEHETMNFIDSPTDYFANVHYLAKMDLRSGKVNKMLGRYPAVYDSQRNLKQFSFVNFDIKSSGDFIISFEGDSLIYEYDANFIPKHTYGYSGRNMKKSERVLVTFDDFRKYYEISRKESGYYTGLKFVNETAMLFRNYSKGVNAVNDGMQIYRDRVLIGDVDVPFGFQVLGYISPYYYATCGIDEENESIVIMKFRI